MAEQTKDYGKSTDDGVTVAKAKEVIEEIDSVEELNAYVEGDTRKGVNEAYTARKDELVDPEADKDSEKPSPQPPSKGDKEEDEAEAKVEKAESDKAPDEEKSEVSKADEAPEQKETEEADSKDETPEEKAEESDEEQALDEEAQPEKIEVIVVGKETVAALAAAVAARQDQVKVMRGISGKPDHIDKALAEACTKLERLPLDEDAPLKADDYRQIRKAVAERIDADRYRRGMQQPSAEDRALAEALEAFEKADH